MLIEDISVLSIAFVSFAFAVPFNALVLTAVALMQFEEYSMDVKSISVKVMSAHWLPLARVQR